jgi:pimeloyl-ACP methyl ester carboxylesterase
MRIDVAGGHINAVVVDVRGYGDSFVPDGVEAYRLLAHVADNVAVVRGLGADTAVLVGDDWGSAIAMASAQVRPDPFTGVAMLGVPYARPNGCPPTPAPT